MVSRDERPELDGKPHWFDNNVAATLQNAADAVELASRMRVAGVDSMLWCAGDGQIRAVRSESELAQAPTAAPSQRPPAVLPSQRTSAGPATVPVGRSGQR